jgi:hypothetical protein
MSEHEQIIFFSRKVTIEEVFKGEGSSGGRGV